MITERQDDFDTAMMSRALGLARQAEQAGEVPIGAVIVMDDEIIAEGWNRPIATHDPTAHAEVNALRAAAARLGNYRLPGTALYVTLEPCVMCAGAIIHARLARVVYGAADARAGAAGSVFDVLGTVRLNHQVAVRGGVLEQQCAAILQEFFRRKR